LVRLVAEMLGQLGRHRPLHQPLRQLREHTARPDDLLLRPSAREQLVDHLVGEAIANRVRKLERLAAIRSVLVFLDMTLLRFRHAYTADRTLPVEAPPSEPAQALGVVGLLDLRRDPFEAARLPGWPVLLAAEALRSRSGRGFEPSRSATHKVRV
jgi:hypothetical protein